MAKFAYSISRRVCSARFWKRENWPNQQYPSCPGRCISQMLQTVTVTLWRYWNQIGNNFVVYSEIDVNKCALTCLLYLYRVAEKPEARYSVIKHGIWRAIEAVYVRTPWYYCSINRTGGNHVTIATINFVTVVTGVFLVPTDHRTGVSFDFFIGFSGLVYKLTGQVQCFSLSRLLARAA